MAAVDITGEVNKKGVFALNEDRLKNHDNIFIGDRRLVCRSDADSQLLVHVPFNQSVRISAIRFDAPEDEAPTIAKIFVNAPAMSFEDVEDADPAQILELSPSNFGESAKEIKLKVVKFNRVNSLHIFLDREGADKVSVASIKFFGSPVEGVTKDLKDLGKKPEGEA